MKTAQLFQNKHPYAGTIPIDGLPYSTSTARPNNLGGPNWPLLLLIILCIALLVTGFSGCGINKATQRVLANDAAFNKVGTTWAKLNPCVVDSFKTLVHDTTVHTDTAFKLIQATTPKTLQPGTGMVCKHDTLMQTITKTITVHDSVKVVSVDKRQLNLCNDSIAWYKNVFTNYKNDMGKQLDGWKHKARSRFWYLTGLLIVIAVYLFRKPLLAAFGGVPALITKII